MSQTPTLGCHVYTKNHTFFDDLVTMLFQLTANMSTLTGFISLNSMEDRTKRYLASYDPQAPFFRLDNSHYPEIFRHLFYLAVATINPDEPFTLSSRHQPYNAYFYPYHIVAPISNDTWPSSVEIFFGAKLIGEIASEPNLKQMLSSEEHQYPMKSTIRSSFISYFESQKRAIADRCKQQNTELPMVWKFAQVVRNACGHGGTIYVKDPKTKAVSWRNYEYAHKDNDTDILYGEQGLSTVDIILLFEDMHNAL